MLDTKDIFNLLKENSINCFCGVPDSLLKDFCAYITDHTTNTEHTITANEGNAIALAAGHFLATGEPALVYMQNSGIGNCVNPLLSLVDPEVYNIPLLMFIGWRGEPNTPDEPQHIKQGKVTDKLLEAMGIRYSILPSNMEDAKNIILHAVHYIKDKQVPYALIIKKGTFHKYTSAHKKSNSYVLSREQAIETILKHLTQKDIIVSTTGHISREIYETRERLNQSHKQDFLTVGSMGHASSIALGIALGKSNRTVYCIDGDGALLMHEGALGVNASKNLTNFKHIVLNNEAHDSVGSQPTVANKINISQIALNSGYKEVYSVSSKEDLINTLPIFISIPSTSLLEIKVRCGARNDLGRPKEKPSENKKIFMENLNQIEFCYRNSIENLSKILKLECAKKILIFTGKNSYQSIKPIIEKELQQVQYAYYNNFSVNPKKGEIELALQSVDPNYNFIIAIGGGSVIDFAKGFRYYSTKKSKLLAIPTTAGTGSEATQFSVIYTNGAKNSIDDKSILPEYAIVDSQFIENSPKYLKACTSMDAFCHAIESYWSVKSTLLSREYAKQAILLCRDNIVNYVNSNDPETAKNMMKAANLAGKAINLSRTTAAHALSYALTTRYNLPHGHAVALNMGYVFEQNLRRENATTDPRGTDFVQARLTEIMELLSLQNPTVYFNTLLTKIGLEYSWDNLGINLDWMFSQVNKSRLNNNPKKIL